VKGAEDVRLCTDLRGYEPRDSHVLALRTWGSIATNRRLGKSDDTAKCHPIVRHLAVGPQKQGEGGMTGDQAQYRGVHSWESDFFATTTHSKVDEDRTQHLPDTRKKIMGGAHPVSLEAPLHDVTSTMQGLAARSNAGADERLSYFLPAGKDSRHVP